MQVDEEQALLLGKGLREVVRRHPAVLDDDLAEPLATLVALQERLSELLRGQQTVAHEQRAEP